MTENLLKNFIWINDSEFMKNDFDYENIEWKNKRNEKFYKKIGIITEWVD